MVKAKGLKSWVSGELCAPKPCAVTLLVITSASPSWEGEAGPAHTFPTQPLQLVPQARAQRPGTQSTLEVTRIDTQSWPLRGK